jgi:Polysaccharide pyruvyl transferase
MPVSAITNFFHSTADNIGDRMCGPGQYIWPKTCTNIPLLSKPDHPITVAIVGGGQIFAQLSAVSCSIRDQNVEAKIIAWGVGLPPKGRRDRLVRQVATQFSAFGTRNYDWREHLDFVPCASCLAPALDDAGSARHEIVAYLHRRKDAPQNIPDEIPVMTNAMRSPREVMEFIASGETVVTSSYHGVYWAQLLGRRVICVPYNDKFQTFQHPPTLVDPASWRSEVGRASRTEPLLEEYRALNHAFALRVSKFWNG